MLLARRLFVALTAILFVHSVHAATVLDDDFLGSGSTVPGWTQPVTGTVVNLGGSIVTIQSGFGPPAILLSSVFFDPQGLTTTVVAEIESNTGPSTLGAGIALTSPAFGFSLAVLVTDNGAVVARAAQVGTVLGVYPLGTIAPYSGGAIDLTVVLDSNGFQVTTDTGYDSGLVTWFTAFAGAFDLSNLSNTAQLWLGAFAPSQTFEVDRVTVTSDVVPTISADAGADQSANEGVLGVQLDGSGSSGATNYAWTQVAGPTVTLIPNNTTVNPSFDAPYVANNTTLTFQLTVDDGGSGSDMDTVDIVVVQFNNPPVAVASGPATIKEGAEGTLDGSGSFDPESDTPLTYSWTQTSGPPVALDETDPTMPTFTAPAAGNQLVFELVVDDGKEASAPDSVTVDVVANSQPMADAGVDQTVDEGTVVNLDGTGSSDSDGGDTLSYAWTGPEMLTGANTATPSFTAPLVGPAGAALTFNLTVTDDDPFNPLSDTDQVIVNVLDLNAPPRCDLAQAVCFKSSSEKSKKSKKSKKSEKSGKSGKSKSGKAVARDCTVLRRHNHKFVLVKIEGITDPENDSVTLAVTGVTQDEPTSGLGGGDSSPDAVLQGESALVRRERDKNGNGRVYELSFTATDAGGASCNGTLNLSVPVKKNDPVIDDGQIYDSTQP